MKKTLLILFILLLSATAFAQSNSSSFEWAFNTGGGYNTTKRIQYNSQGDLLAMVTIGNTTNFGGTLIQAPGFSTYPGTATFIGKRSQSGTKTVVLKLLSNNSTYATLDDFVIDSNDNIIISGATFGYNETVFYDFGNGITLYGKGNYVAKYNANGECQWAKLITYNLATASSTESKPIGLGVLPNNDIYFAGRSTNGSRPFWLVRFDPNGNEIWHKEWLLSSPSYSIAIASSKNNCFFDDNGNAYFYVTNLTGDATLTLDGQPLTAPGTGHPSSVSLVTIDGSGNNGLFTTYRGAFGDLAVEKSTGNILLIWSQYHANPAPFDTVSYNSFGQYGGIVAINSNRGYINSTTGFVFGGAQIESLFPLGNLNFVGNDILAPTEVITAGAQTFTATNYTTAWKFFENFNFTKFVAHPEMNGNETKAYSLMARFNNKLAVSGEYKLENNATINVNGTTLTSCEHDLTFGATYPSFASLASDVFIAQLLLDPSLSVADTKSKSAKITLFPNPTAAVLNLQTNEQIENAVLKITSVSGQVIVQQNNLSGKDFVVNVSGLKSGLYIVEIANSNVTYISKFIKK